MSVRKDKVEQHNKINYDEYISVLSLLHNRSFEIHKETKDEELIYITNNKSIKLTNTMKHVHN